MNQSKVLIVVFHYVLSRTPRDAVWRATSAAYTPLWAAAGPAATWSPNLWWQADSQTCFAVSVALCQPASGEYYSSCVCVCEHASITSLHKASSLRLRVSKRVSVMFFWNTCGISVLLVTWIKNHELRVICYHMTRCKTYKHNQQWTKEIIHSWYICLIIQLHPTWHCRDASVCMQNLSSCLWWLFNKDPGRLYLELQFFCAVANYGQVLVCGGA